MKPKLYFIDFETRAAVDIKKVGLKTYIAACDFLCLGVVNQAGRKWLLTSLDESLPFSPIDVLVAHNAKFDRSVLQKFWPKYQNRFFCTLAQAQAHCLSGKLADVGEFFQSRKYSQKSLHTLMKPRKNGQYWTIEEKPDEYNLLYQYCMQDAEICRIAYNSLPPWTKREHRIWTITEEINDRGIPIDVEMIPPTIALLNDEAEILSQECERITGGIKPSQAVKLAEYCNLPSVAKDPLAKALEGDQLKPPQRKALEIRQCIAKSSVKKLQKMYQLAENGRVHDTLNYCGADKTHRWSGRTIQPQNLPRGDKSSDNFDKLKAILYGDPTSEVSIECGEAHQIVSDNIRRFIVGPLLVGDYAQIEARVLAWLAGESSMVKAFANRKDVYKLQASKTFNIPQSDVNSDQRFIGKQQVLSLGYQCGAPNFKRNLAKYKKVITERESKQFVDSYRASNQKIVQFWWDLQDTARYVIRNPTSGSKRLGKLVFHPMLKYPCLGFAIELPNGSKIYYPKAYVDKDNKIVFWGRQGETAKRGWINTYGGKLAENVTSSTSRQILGDALIALHEKGYEIITLVHDEIVAICSDESKLEEFNTIMETSSLNWTQGLPIAVESEIQDRYHKS